MKMADSKAIRDLDWPVFDSMPCRCKPRLKVAYPVRRSSRPEHIPGMANNPFLPVGQKADAEGHAHDGGVGLRPCRRTS
jgi:hypothetical protein